MEQLAFRVRAALEALGLGFLQHPANASLREALAQGELTPRAYFGELLRLVYRLIFLVTLEERELLHPSATSEGAREAYAEGYAITRLRDRSRRAGLHDRHADLWEALRPVIRALGHEGGLPTLGLPALGGIFAPAQCPQLDAANLANPPFLSALRQLLWLDLGGSLEPINWKDMDTEEFGSVYESLLELEPVVDAGARTFAFAASDAARGNARKTTGSYYTPDSLVQQLLDSALEPVVTDRLAGALTREAQEAALLSLTVIDPACGSGHFLLAAARRLAGHLARIRAEGTPTAAELRLALRDVVAHCVFGTDLNPMALELARMALWLEACTPERPLSFIDHHLQCGNALLGLIDLHVMREGVPDEAFKALTGDDKETAKAACAVNRQARRQLVKAAESRQLRLDFRDAGLVAALEALEQGNEDSLADIEAKRAQWDEIAEGTRDHPLARAADVLVGAYLVPKREGQAVPTSVDLVPLLLGAQAGEVPAAERAARAACREARVLHWPLAFPQVFARGGFDVVLGNPPWEVSQLDEGEYFASRSPDIAKQAGVARKRAIALLEAENPRLWAQFLEAKRGFEALGEFWRSSDRFALTAHGKLNTYALFAETALRINASRGRVGVIVQSGVASDDGNKHFFAHIAAGRLVELVDFENREGLFPAVDSRMKFCLLTLGQAPRARLAFFLTDPAQRADERRSFTLEAEDFARLNPNTRTCPVFRSARDADLTTAIYRRVPVLIDEGREDGNPWGLDFRQGLFNMTNDSHLFRTAAERHELADPVPLYEAKMVHHFDHRWAAYDDEGESTRDLSDEEKRDPHRTATPRYWVERREVDLRLAAKGWTRGWLLGFRDICRATDERTVIAGVIPRVGVGNQLPLLFTSQAPAVCTALGACLSSLVLDYHARHKVGGTHLNFFLAKQLAVLPPAVFTPPILDAIIPRALELSFTAWDLRPFYDDLMEENPAWDPRSGAERGQPWRWDPERRALLRAELDALYAHLYGLNRDELRYVLDPAEVMGDDYPTETFRVLKANELKRFGEYRTRRLVLEAWDRFEGRGWPG
jgi:hypothetical protein